MPRDIGPLLDSSGVTYRVWAMGHSSIVVHIEKPNTKSYALSLKQTGDSGYFHETDLLGKAGDLYRFSIDGAAPIPDFASHYQPRGVFGSSMVVDAKAYDWQAADWQRPAWNGQVVYECHLGTFTPKGTFLSAIEKLDHLRSLGITAIELMPLAEWAGERGWGYDGVMLFAPHHAYGTPRDFQALIDACHQRGIAVILDVVFNHLGPEGNFSHQYSDYFFHENKNTPWGQNFNLDGPHSEPVRAFLRQNIRYWLDDFRIDGFRMDATHAIHDPSPVHLLKEISDLVHNRGSFIIAEDDRNAREILEPREKHGWHFDAAWADDFHHVMRVNQTGEQQLYYRMYSGSVEEMARTLRQGWLYCGQASPFHPRGRGTPCEDFAPERFIYCISNHDQVGNRLLGDRLHLGIDSAAYRALSLFLCLVPYTPMLFMGQEWGATSPFLYFTDMPEELGRKITEGRKREFMETAFVTNPGDLEKSADPQDPKTFLRSKLNWNEIHEEEHRCLLNLYREGLKLRKSLFAEKNPPRSCWQVETFMNGVGIQYQLQDQRIDVRLHLYAEAPLSLQNSQILLRSNAPEFAKSGSEFKIETIVSCGC